MKNITKLTFKRFIMTIGILPSSYVDSLSYYECLVWLCKFLEDTVIPTLNNNAEAVEELQEKYIELKNYVDNYFENLDVQEEINNKLDDMVESGTLQEIISEYLNSTAIFGFDTVADMISATNLVEGSYAKTLGYHTINDGGGTLYKIVALNSDNAELINGMDYINLGNDLVAILINIGILRFEQFGAYGDDSHDDTEVLKYCLESNNDYVFKPLNKVYKVTEAININTEKNYDFNNATLKAYHDGNILYCYEEAVDFTSKGSIVNLILDCNNQANSGLYINTWFKNYDKIKIINVHTYGIYLNGGYENQFGTIRLNSNANNTNAIGIYIGASDSQFNDLYGIDLKTFIKCNNRYAIINNIHAWILTTSLSIGSKLIDLTGNQNHLAIKYLYVDTYHYGIYQTNNENSLNILKIEELFEICHPTNFDFTGADRPIVFSQYNNANSINYYIGSATVKAEDSSHNIIFSETRNTNQTPSWNGFISKSYISSNVDTLNVLNEELTVTSNLFSTVDINKINKIGGVVELNFVGKVNASNMDHTIKTIGKILTYTAPRQNINTSCTISTSEYSSNDNETLCYLFIDTAGNVQIDIPDGYTISNNDYIKIHILYGINK